MQGRWRGGEEKESQINAAWRGLAWRDEAKSRSSAVSARCPAARRGGSAGQVFHSPPCDCERRQ
ncbi:hypothetical protein E2C01_088925 [Portunus trituberculatus]|uniref:Uncharacterized protein n=1 Tax=Portunus trituberculatus TaxID=210409 RepID=A0A5B7JGS8_PORTR|nr:hypothetical protein [Portunus trituberculatus]